MLADTAVNNAAAWFLFAMVCYFIIACFIVAHEKVQNFKDSWRQRGGGGGAFPRGWAREAAGYRETRKIERHMGHHHGL